MEIRRSECDGETKFERQRRSTINEGMPGVEVDCDVHTEKSMFLVAAVDDRREIIRDQSSTERAVV